MRKEFPDAKLKASTFENYFSALSTIRDKLPVFEQEVGDTWMQGIASDPKKMAQYRALYRVLGQCIQSGIYFGKSVLEQFLPRIKAKELLFEDETLFLK